MKLMYASGVWSYVVRALSMLPMIAAGGRLAAGWLRVDRLMLVHTAMSWNIPVVVSTHMTSVQHCPSSDRFRSMHVGRCNQHTYLHRHSNHHYLWRLVPNHHQLVGSAGRNCVRPFNSVGAVICPEKQARVADGLHRCSCTHVVSPLAAGAVLCPQPQAPGGSVVCQCRQPGTLVDICEGLLARSRIHHRQERHHIQDHHEGAVPLGAGQCFSAYFALSESRANNTVVSGCMNVHVCAACGAMP